MSDYTTEFYTSQQAASRRSAEVVLPLVVEWVRPRRVVDVGCGVGTWLGALSKLGDIEALGVDGDYVDRSMLQIPPAQFRSHDLSKPLPELGRFDLAISMETAEHLPADWAALFVAGLAQLAPVVLFSAAAPSQGGTCHVNEQWPDYWVKLFSAHRFRVIDCIRHRIWHEPEIAWWYAQNAFLFVHEDRLASSDCLQDLAAKSPEPLPLIHPRNYLEKLGYASGYTDVRNHSLREVVKCLPGMAWNWALGRRRATRPDRPAAS